MTDIRVVTAGYFESLRVPRVAGDVSGVESGRGSRRGGTTPVVVNEAMVRALWPDDDPIGQVAEVSFGTPDTVRVAGVVADVPMADPAQPVRPTLYYPHGDWPMEVMDVTVRADGPAAPVPSAASASRSPASASRSSSTRRVSPASTLSPARTRTCLTVPAIDAPRAACEGPAPGRRRRGCERSRAPTASRS